MENSILFIITTVILLSVAVHIYCKSSECLHRGKVAIENDTINNC